MTQKLKKKKRKKKEFYLHWDTIWSLTSMGGDYTGAKMDKANALFSMQW